MGVNHLGPGSQQQEFSRLWQAIRAVAKATLQNGAIGRAGLRFYDAGRALFQGGGGIQIDDGGYIIINGDLTGIGEIDWSGPSIFRGTLNVTGNSAFGGTLDILGATTIGGAVTMNNDLSLGTGRLIAGPVLIDRAGSYGGRVYSSSILVLDAGSGILMDTNVDIRGILLTDGLDVDGPKSFRITHPSKPGYYLRHGSTESPVSGIEYWGDDVLDDDGRLVIELPEYFEDLAKPEGRTVFITGRSFSADWTDIDDGKFTVTGPAAGRFSWLVKAERIGGDFLLEEEIPPENTDDGRVGPWAPA